MTETANTTPATKPKTKGGKFKFFIFGTALILVAGGIAYQVYNARSAGAQTGDSPGSAIMNKNLARVNGEFITYDAVAQESVSRVGAEVLDNMINRTLILQECKRQGITVSQQEVAEEVKRIAEKFKMPVETWYQMLQSERGLSPLQYNRDIIWPMLALKKLAGTDVQVTQEDMRRAFIRDYGKMVKARMIMVDRFGTAQKVYKLAKANPESFGELAEQYSIEPNSRALQGTIPHIRHYSGNETLENAAFKLKPGEVSGILEVEHGNYVILKCEGFTEPIVTDITLVQEDLVAQVKDEKIQEAVAKVFQKIRNSARIDNYLTRTSTGTNIQQTSGLKTPASVAPKAAAQQPGTARP